MNTFTRATILALFILCSCGLGAVVVAAALLSQAKDPTRRNTQ